MKEQYVYVVTDMLDNIIVALLTNKDAESYIEKYMDFKYTCKINEVILLQTV